MSHLLAEIIQSLPVDVRAANCAPTSQQGLRVKNALSASERRLLDLDAQLAAIMKERHEAVALIHHGKQILSPIRTLPVEILVYIFQLLRPSMTQDYNPTDRHPRVAMFALSSVCRLWRQLACTTSSLWKYCWLSYRHPELNTLWLNRAGTQPLSLFGQIRPFGDVRSWRPFMESIIPYFGQCYELDLVCDGFHDRLDGFSSIPITAPMLKKVRVRQSFSTNLPPVLVNIIQNAPRLENLIVDNVDDLCGHAFDALQVIDIRHTSLRQAMAIISNAPNLHHCTIHSSVFDTRNAGSLIPGLPLIHDHIRTLSIQWRGVDAAGYVPWLESLTLPSLSNLSLTSETAGSNFMPWASVEFLEFLSRSKCRLEALEIDGCSMTSQDGLALFRHASLWPLGRVELRNCPGSLSPDVLDLLTYHPNRPLELPQLNDLIVDGTSLPTQDGLLADMITSRRKASPADSSSKVQVHFPRFDHHFRINHEDDISRIQAMN